MNSCEVSNPLLPPRDAARWGEGVILDPAEKIYTVQEYDSSPKGCFAIRNDARKIFRLKQATPLRDVMYKILIRDTAYHILYNLVTNLLGKTRVYSP